MIAVGDEYNDLTWKTLDEIGIDGAWQEGLSYAFNNPEWTVLCGIPLKRMTGRQYPLHNHPRMKEHPEIFFLWTWLPPDQKVNFGDYWYTFQWQPTPYD